eukprot:CAMPEP_0185037178 /NCGR_PEP_ID=MMETSP1103-20130426/31197_1 /TAXON_ID=36769 /ORGANISM="Paraphysomonas bandaiensis, Strain Caron Lab Isolate" /LENGTH=1936 /DNA_ID=CAMNT_0027575031 /DNA_START=65 /DNA_END=5872 /DNA_ORIENTATION=-
MSQSVDLQEDSDMSDFFINRLLELKTTSNKLKMESVNECCEEAMSALKERGSSRVQLGRNKPTSFSMLSAGLSKQDVNFNIRFSRAWNPNEKVKRGTTSMFGVGALSPHDYENVTSESILNAPITDICLIQRSEIVPEGYYRLARTPSNKKADLNTGSGGTHLYICIKKSVKDDIPPISSVIVIYPDKKEYVPPGFSVVKRGGKPCNINSGTSAERIFMCYKRDASCNPIVDLQIYFPTKNESPPTSFTRLSRSVRNYPVDLNMGTGAPTIGVCYRLDLSGLDCLIPRDLSRGSYMNLLGVNTVIDGAMDVASSDDESHPSHPSSCSSALRDARRKDVMERRISNQSSVDLTEDWDYEKEVSRMSGLEEEVCCSGSASPSPPSEEGSPPSPPVTAVDGRDETASSLSGEDEVAAVRVAKRERDRRHMSTGTIGESEFDSPNGDESGNVRRNSLQGPVEQGDPNKDDDSIGGQSITASVIDPNEHRDTMMGLGSQNDLVVTVQDRPIPRAQGYFLRAVLFGIFGTGELLDTSLSVLKAVIEEGSLFEDCFSGRSPSESMTMLDVTVCALCERLDGCVEVTNNKVLEVIHLIIKRSKGLLTKFCTQSLFRAVSFVCAACSTRSNWVAAGYPTPVQDDGQEIYAFSILRDLIKNVTSRAEHCELDQSLPNVYESCGDIVEVQEDASLYNYNIEHLLSLGESHVIVCDLVTEFFDEVMDSVETSRVTEVALLATAKKTSSTLSPSFWIHMNSISKSLFRNYEVQNAFILLAALCKWSWLGIKSGDSGEAAPRHLGNKLLAIEALREYCRVAGPNLRLSKIMGYQVRRLVVSSMFLNIQYSLSEPRIFSKLLKLLSVLWENWREHIRLEFPVLCEQLVIKILQAPTIKMPPLFHIIALREVMKWFEQPHMLVEMFVNFDMDGVVVSDWNIFAHLIRAVCIFAEKSSRPVVPGSGTGPFPSEASSVGSSATMFGANCLQVSPRDVKIRALEVAAHITRAIMDATGHANLIYMDIIANDDNAEGLGGGWMARGQDEEDDGDDDSSVSSVKNAVRRKSYSIKNRRAVNIQGAELLQQAIKIYQEKESIAKAVKFLISKNFMSDTPHEIASFVRIYKDNFDPTAIGDFLGEGGRNEKEEEYWNLIRYRYTRAVSFVDMEVETALRLYLTGCGFRMPGEAQKIDRFISAFVKVFWQDNRNTEYCPFAHEDTVHLLSYATIMLNTDLHRANLDKKKSAKKMTKVDFIKNLRGCDQGNDIDPEYLGRVYDDIAANRIEMAVDKPGDDATKALKEVADKESTVTDPETHKLYVTELLRNLRNYEDLLRSLSPYTHKFYIMGVDISISMELVSFMFESVWHHFHAIVDGLLTKISNEENVIFSALDVLCNALTSCIFLDLKVEKLAFATQLARFRHICEMAEASDGPSAGKSLQTGASFASGAFRKEKWFMSVEQSTAETAITAIAEVHGIIVLLKDVVRLCARREATKLVFARIEKKANLKDSNRFFIMEGDLRKKSRTGKYSLYRFFLFSDMLVYAHQGFSEYKVHGQLDLENTTLDGYVKDDASNCSFYVNNPKKSFVVMAESHAEKQMWFRSINDAISTFTHRRQGRRLSILDRMESQEKEVSSRQMLHESISAKSSRNLLGRAASSTSIPAIDGAKSESGEVQCTPDNENEVPASSVESESPGKIIQMSPFSEVESTGAKADENIAATSTDFGHGSVQVDKTSTDFSHVNVQVNKTPVSMGYTSEHNMNGLEIDSFDESTNELLQIEGRALSRRDSKSTPDRNDPFVSYSEVRGPFKDSGSGADHSCRSVGSSPSPEHGNASTSREGSLNGDHDPDTPINREARSLSALSSDTSHQESDISETGDDPLHDCSVYVSQLNAKRLSRLFIKGLKQWKDLLDSKAPMADPIKFKLYGLYKLAKDGPAPKVDSTEENMECIQYRQMKAW